jgi:hypothetical protein
MAKAPLRLPPPYEQRAYGQILIIIIIIRHMQRMYVCVQHDLPAVEAWNQPQQLLAAA